VSSVGSFFSYVNDARSHESEILLQILNSQTLRSCCCIVYHYVCSSLCAFCCVAYRGCIFFIPSAT